MAPVDRTRLFRANAPAWCQGALPRFEDALRKRPLAVQNEGEGAAFLSCGVPTQGRVEALVVYTFSSADVDHAITCTLVTGFQNGSNTYVPKTRGVAAHGGMTSFVWHAVEFGGDEAARDFVSLSCLLPPGTAIADVQLAFAEDVGS